METINSVASAAAKAVWGESTQQQQHGDEPVSGQTGNTAKGEPYDAGNLEEPKSTTNESASQHQSTTGLNDSAEFSKSTGTATTSEETPNHPSTNLKTRDVPEDTTQGQNDVRGPDDPHTNPKSAPTDVDNTGDGPNEAQKLDGPGPKPLEDVAKEHGGDAAKKTRSSGSVDSAGRTSGAGDADPGAESKGEGTGEKYVKSSGLKADGGDFDVTLPGAGREADRLMEEKGIHPNEGHSHGGDKGGDSTKHDDNHGEKKGLGQKIKDKLHRH
ncbi:hypothetical protein SLS62_006469 [Diatrype stigma]|uniref:Uncharacterized protein n=1 Tax=Diatrype stigma TaxID=117547 RepID=A0AAN9V163_9PEZI